MRKNLGLQSKSCKLIECSIPREQLALVSLSLACLSLTSACSLTLANTTEPIVFFQDSVQVSPVASPRTWLENLNFNDPLFAMQWFLENSGQISRTGTIGVVGADIRLSENWTTHTLKAHTVLALIDTGVDFTHPDLNISKIYRNPGESGLDAQGRDRANNGIDDDGNGLVDDWQGWNFADNTREIHDSIGHGTHLAGLLIGQSNNAIGIAAPWDQFLLLPIQIFSGAHPAVSASVISQALRYAVDQGARVISASFGTPSESSEILAALKYARSRDVLVVSAVGNFRTNVDTQPNYPAGYRLENQISVGSSDRRDLASTFSSFGRSVDISAPGEDIVSTSPQGAYAERSGTSQACPLVAATAAQIRAQYPQLSAQEVKARILAGADSLSGLIGFNSAGLRLNVSHALAGTQGARLPEAPQKGDVQWQRTEAQFETEHPYRANQKVSIRITAPSGSSRMRIHFKRFITQSTDVLALQDPQGSWKAQWSGELGEFWSPIFEGQTANLTFSTDAFVSDWGWQIDLIESQ